MVPFCPPHSPCRRCCSLVFANKRVEPPLCFPVFRNILCHSPAFFQLANPPPPMLFLSLQGFFTLFNNEGIRLSALDRSPRPQKGFPLSGFPPKRFSPFFSGAHDLRFVFFIFFGVDGVAAFGETFDSSSFFEKIFSSSQPGFALFSRFSITFRSIRPCFGIRLAFAFHSFADC